MSFFAFSKDYEGEPGNAIQGRDYFRSRFTKLSRKSGQAREREIYVQYVLDYDHPRRPSPESCHNPDILLANLSLFTKSFTNATDTALLRVVMAAVEGKRLLSFIVNLTMSDQYNAPPVPLPFSRPE